MFDAQPHVAVFDLDHCLSDAEWRDKYIKYPMSDDDWSLYHTKSAHDGSNQKIIETVHHLKKASFDIWIVTSRPERFYNETRYWLNLHEIPFDHLLMRPEGSKLTCSVLKVELCKEFLQDYRDAKIVFAFDNSESVIKALEKEFGCQGFICNCNWIREYEYKEHIKINT